MPMNAIIVGMPRSGTSMVTNIFAKAGFFVAENESNELRAGDEFNPSGYWEAKDLINANDEIFSSVGFSPDNTWLHDSITDKQANDLFLIDKNENHTQLIDKYETHQPWVWKDPRLCYTLAYWWPLLKNSNTKVLFLTRNPEEIYNSFVRLNWRKESSTTRSEVFRRIEHHLAFVKNTLDRYNAPFIEVDYSEFKLNPEKTSKRISEFFNVSINSNDLGFDSRLNTSGLRGAVMKLVDRIGDKLPDTLRKKIKSLIPKKLLASIFPHRYID